MSHIWCCENTVEPTESSRHQSSFHLLAILSPNCISLRWRETPKRSDSEKANGFILKTQRQLTNGCHHGGRGNERRQKQRNKLRGRVRFHLHVSESDRWLINTGGGKERGRDGVWFQDTEGKDAEREQFKNRLINQLPTQRSSSLRFCPTFFSSLSTRHPPPVLFFLFSLQNLLWKKSHQAA